MNDRDKYEPFENPEPSAVKSAWKMFESITDVLMWLWDAACFYICMVWVMPMLFMFLISVFIDLRPVVRPNLQNMLWLSLAGLPLWLIVSGYSRLAKSAWAKRIVAVERKATLAAGSLLIIVGIFTWLF